MKDEYYEIESIKPFSQSLIWKLNRDYYQDKGVTAWSEDAVPHQMTSNSKVGKIYAELILAFLKDLSAKGKTTETVYILELGAGHGRLAFHILKHLQKLEPVLGIELPPYCYIVSDIVEKNLDFYRDHPQFQEYFKKGNLDLAYYDASNSQEIFLRYSKITIKAQSLDQPIVVIANYFFDSIPNDLFIVKDGLISSCSVSLQSKENPNDLSAEMLIKSMELTYHNNLLEKPFYAEPILNEILEDYKELISDTHLFFPERGMHCIKNIKSFSTEGMMLLSMDKGFHEIHDLEKKGEPDLVTHGSFSLWVNYHALIAFCEKTGGQVLFPTASTFHLDFGCLLFLADSSTYFKTQTTYEHYVNDFGPDDFNSIKKLAYLSVAGLTTMELIALYRLSTYDSTFFINLLPRLKQVTQAITFNERRRVEQTLHNVWEMYFSINESYDLAYELAGLFYDLGFYNEALDYFQFSWDSFGPKTDIYYNRILCYYQLRQDHLFAKTLKEAKLTYPNEAIFDSLENLDMTTVKI